MKKAIIGGTGVYDASTESRTESISTKYGEALVDIVKIDGEEIVFLARHGKEHGTPPHKINYKANMAALKELGVEIVLATCAVGSCNSNYQVGDLVLIEDFLDFTKGRAFTFFDGDDGQVVHTDMSDPYCKFLRKEMKAQAQKLSINLKEGATYVCAEGPRFETPAEIKFYHKIGGDIVGMTNVPEVVLAKEMEMHYAAIGLISNWCTGFNCEGAIFHDINKALKTAKEEGMNIMLKTLKNIKIEEADCGCKNAKMIL